MKLFVIVQKKGKESRMLDMVTSKTIQYVQENAMSRRKIKNNARLVRLICFVRFKNTQKAALS